MFSALAFALANLPRRFEGFAFGFLYPFYLIKFHEERDYVAGRLRRARLNAKPRDVYRNIFLNGLDSLRFLMNKKVAVKFENLDLALNEAGRNPIVFVSIHSGAFEMLHRGLAQLGRDVHLVVSEFRNKKLDKFLTKTRAAKNIKVVKDFDASKALKSAIRSKEIIAIMADQSKRGAETFRILGGDVPIFLKLPLMANRLGASLVFFRTFRDGSHVIRFERVYRPNSEIDNNEIAKMIESWILEHPDQWTWNYRSASFIARKILSKAPTGSA